MSALENLLTRAEANAAARAAYVASLTHSWTVIKEAVDVAKKDHRKALGAVVRLRGAIEAVRELPEADEILAEDAPVAEEASEPVFVAIPDLPVAFTPALDHTPAPQVEVGNEEPEKAWRVLPPKPEPEPVDEEPFVPAVKLTGKSRTRITGLADRIFTMLSDVRHGTTASIEVETLVSRTGMSPSAIRLAIENLAERGLIRKCKVAERGHFTVLFKDAPAGAGA